MFRPMCIINNINVNFIDPTLGTVVQYCPPGVSPTSPPRVTFTVMFLLCFRNVSSTWTT